MLHLVTLHNVYRKLLASFSLPGVTLFPLTPRPALLHAMQPPTASLLPESHHQMKSHAGDEYKLLD